MWYTYFRLTREFIRRRCCDVCLSSYFFYFLEMIGRRFWRIYYYYSKDERKKFAIYSLSFPIWYKPSVSSSTESSSNHFSPKISILDFLFFSNTSITRDGLISRIPISCTERNKSLGAKRNPSRWTEKKERERERKDTHISKKRKGKQRNIWFEINLYFPKTKQVRLS